MQSNPLKHVLFLTVVWTQSALVPGALAGLSNTVEIRVDAQQVGLLGHVRGGEWMGLLVELDNRSIQPLEVSCQWLVPDADGDMVVAQRPVTLSPQRTGRLWLYAAVPQNTREGDSWQVRVVDPQENRVLAAETVGPIGLLDRHATVVGLVGTGVLGLGPYFSAATAQEGCRLLRPIEPALLPDRWYGLSTLQSLIWTAQGQSPDSLAIPADTHRAIRQWVRRGGHLVVVLDAVADPWFASPLADLLPPVRVGDGGRQPPPPWLGEPQAATLPPVTVRVLEPHGPDAAKVSVLLRDGSQRPVVVAWPFGFGRVTLVGIDLGDPKLAAAGLPNGPGLWSSLFGWRSPAYDVGQVAEELGRRTMTGPSFRQHVLLDAFIGRLIAMRETVSPALLAATVVFGLYWLLAGPVGFAVLKRRGQERHSWWVFCVVVALFGAVCWTGAFLWRSDNATIAHVTLLDIRDDSKLARVRSWLSLYVPHHHRVDVAVEPDSTERHDQSPNTLANPGCDDSSAAFLDQQQYVIQAGSPHRMHLPMRATAKQLTLSYLGRPAEGRPASAGWVHGDLRVVDDALDGQLVHHLPGEIQNLLIVYCPGDGRTPRLWRRRAAWSPDEPLSFREHHRFELLVEPYGDEHKRVARREGYLGRLVAFKTGRSWATEDRGRSAIADNEIVQAIEMLSFYSVLPPPDFRSTDFMNRPVQYDRHLGRPFDLSPWVALRCVILIGHIEKGPLLAPLRVDGQPVEASGWTVVRWIASI